MLVRGDSVSAQRAVAFRSQDCDRVASDTARHDEGDVSAEVLAIVAERDALSDELFALRKMFDAAIATAREDGRDEGRAEARDIDDDRTAKLGAAVAEVREALHARLIGDRDVAVEIALAALRRIVGNPQNYRELVAETARINASTLEQSTIVRLCVSRSDFVDDEDLARLQQSLRNVRVEIDPSLPAGGCRFDLTMGHLDAAILDQAAQLDQMLGYGGAQQDERA